MELSEAVERQNLKKKKKKRKKKKLPKGFQRLATGWVKVFWHLGILLF